MCEKVRFLLGYKSHRRRDIIKRNFRVLTLPHTLESPSQHGEDLDQPIRFGEVVEDPV